MKAQRVMRRIIMMTLTIAATGLSLHAQTYPFREYTSDDGLPQTQSTSVMQDSRGYMWIPTRNGLARFDGTTFVSYLRKDGLPSNMINTVLEDKRGTIWAVTLNGLARFNGKKFISYPIPDSLRVKQIVQSCTSFDTATFFLSAAIDEEKQMILYFENGRYTNYEQHHPALQNRRLKPAAANPTDTTLYLLNDNNEAFAYARRVLRKVHNSPVEDISIINNVPYFNPTLKYMSAESESLQWEGGKHAFYYKDREGTVWTGTETSIFRLISEAFVEYDRDNGLPDETWAVAADPYGGLWTGSVSGELRYFDGETFTKKNEYQKLFDYPMAFFRGSTTLSNGEIWFSTKEGVLVWDGRKFRRPAIDIETSQVCIIYEDPVDHSVMVGTDRGLYHIKDKKTTLYKQMSWPGHGIVEGVARDHDGNYWLAGHYGVVFFDGKTFVPFLSGPTPSESVWGIVCDYMGNIWSAGSEGLYICNPDEPVFNRALPGEVNLPANVIRDMGDHRLIVGRMMDICIIDLDKYYSGHEDFYTIIDRSRGFAGNECQDNGIVRDADGTWWILTADRLIRFDPDKFSANTCPPITHITLAEIPGDTTAWMTALDTILFYDTNSSLRIRGRKNNVRISYTGISTRNPENVTYQHRMLGLDDFWSENTAERSVVFNDLPPGDYTFEVRAINSDGVKALRPDRMSITVVPTFFQSVPAILLLSVLGLSLIVFLSWQIRKSVLERRVQAARQQAETYRLQLNSVIKQFDPHFTFNALTSVGSLIMKGEKEKAYNYFIKLSNLLRSIINDSGVLFRPLQQELEFVTRYCELQKLRFGRRIEYRIEVSPDVNLATPVPKMIIQSFAENAIKHGLENKQDHGIMEITLRNLNEGVELTIRDNGIGRAAAAEMGTRGAGTGLKNIAGIVDTINRANKEKITFTLTDLFNNGKPSGTEVRVFLPHNYSINITA
ncbi:MAG: histidine kinase [Bacteroidales bacterium]|nr:histidine kinase [Bacteroidales bacterium]